MKLTWAVLALASASDDGEDKKYVNKDNFMDAPTPDWWTNHPAEKRAKTYFKKSPKKFLQAWIPEDYQSDWELKFRQLNKVRTDKLNKLIEKNECGRDAVAGGATDDDEENERRRRSVVNMLASQDLSVDEVAIIDAEEAGLAPRKIRGEDLRKDINKMFGNMARYVVEEVLRTQNAKKCNRMGYRMVSTFIEFLTNFLSQIFDEQFSCTESKDSVWLQCTFTAEGLTTASIQKTTCATGIPKP